MIGDSRVSHPVFHPASVIRVLFLCTGNAARSILAEALLNRLGQGRFRAYSAGANPKGKVHPHALRLLSDLGFATDGMRSKSWQEFQNTDAPGLDVVITVCDGAAEQCPVWTGQPLSAHWGMPDPATASGDAMAPAFRQAYQTLENRIAAFLALPWSESDRSSLQQQLNAIGHDDVTA